MLKDPLWYAAKWGGFQDQDKNDRPNLSTEWDEDNDGDPDNYFLVTNALTLNAQLDQGLQGNRRARGSASSASVNSGSISSDTRVYQAKFNSGDWSGQLLSFPVAMDGTLATPEEWDAGKVIPAPDSSQIITVNTNSTAAKFRWTGRARSEPTRKAQLRQTDPSTPTTGASIASITCAATARAKIAATTCAGVPQPPVLPYETCWVTSCRRRQYSWASRPSSIADTLETRAVLGVPHAQGGSREDRLRGRQRRHVARVQCHVSGVETLAFIPGQVFRNLPELTKTCTPIATSSTARRRLATSSTAAPGTRCWSAVSTRAVRASTRSTSRTRASSHEDNASSIFRWQFSDKDGDANAQQRPDLGYTYSRPAIVRMPNGTSGSRSSATATTTPTTPRRSTGHRQRRALHRGHPDGGNLIKKIDTKRRGPGPDSIAPNGLATPALVDINGDSHRRLRLSRATCSETCGSSTSPSNSATASWDVAYYSARTTRAALRRPGFCSGSQPITSRPEVGRGPKGAGMVVLFGTGKFLEGADNDVALDGLRDGRRASTSVGGPDLGQGGEPAADHRERPRRTHQAVRLPTSGPFPVLEADGPDADTLPDTMIYLPLRVTTNSARRLASPTERGWYLDLAVAQRAELRSQARRVVSDAECSRNGRVIFTDAGS